MIGTWLNVGAVFLGALLGLATKVEVSAQRQQFIRVLLGVATVWFGLKLVWNGLASSTARFFFHQLLIVLLAMIIGHLIGKLFRIQMLFNRIGHDAKLKLENAAAHKRKGSSDGFIAATMLFCAAPLGIVGALEDGLVGYFAPLAIKAVMDGLAAMAFARMFGWTALLSAVPVAAFLLTLTTAGVHLEPMLTGHGLLGVVHASAGLVITNVALVIFEVKKVEIANYLPAIAVAPALMKLSQIIFS